MKEISCVDKWYDKALQWVVYLVAILVPLVFCPWVNTVFSEPKIFILRILSLIGLGLIGCKWFVEGKIQYKRTPWNIFLLIFSTVNIATTFTSKSFYTSLYGAEGRFLGLITMLNFAFFAWLVVNVLKHETAKRLVKIMVGTSGVLALYGLAQWSGIAESINKIFWSDNFIWSESPTERVFGTVGHPNHFGAYLGMCGMLGIWWLVIAKKTYEKIIVSLIILLNTVIVVLTGSRGALAALIGGIGIWLMYGVILHRKKVLQAIQSTIGKIIALVSIVAILLLVVTGTLNKIPFIERTAATINFMNQGNVPDRISWWLSTIAMFQDAPLFGHGLSTYRDIFNEYRRKDYKVDAPGDMQDLITPEAAHNEYLNILATQGIVGFAITFVLIGYALFKIHSEIKSKHSKIDHKYLYIGYISAIGVYLIEVFVSFGVITTQVILFTILAAAMSGVPMRDEKTVKLNGIKSFVMILFIAVILGGSVPYTFGEMSAEWHYKQASIAELKGKMEDAIEHYQYAILAKPYEYSYLQGFGDFALKQSSNSNLSTSVRQKMVVLAIANYQKAIDINPFHPSLYFNLASSEFRLSEVLNSKGKSMTAMSHLSKAVEIAVNNPLYPYQAAKILQSLGQPEAVLIAKDYFQKALAIRPGYRDAQQLLDQINTPTKALN